MDRSVALHFTILRQLAAHHGGYESATEVGLRRCPRPPASPTLSHRCTRLGDATTRVPLCRCRCRSQGDSIILGFHDAMTALKCTMEAQAALVLADWPEALLEHPLCAPQYATGAGKVRERPRPAVPRDVAKARRRAHVAADAEGHTGRATRRPSCRPAPRCGRALPRRWRSNPRKTWTPTRTPTGAACCHRAAGRPCGRASRWPTRPTQRPRAVPARSRRPARPRARAPGRRRPAVWGRSRRLDPSPCRATGWDTRPARPARTRRTAARPWAATSRSTARWMVWPGRATTCGRRRARGGQSGSGWSQ